MQTHQRYEIRSALHEIDKQIPKAPRIGPVVTERCLVAASASALWDNDYRRLVRNLRRLVAQNSHRSTLWAGVLQQVAEALT